VFFCWVLSTRFIMFPLHIKLPFSLPFTLYAFYIYWTEYRYSKRDLLSRIIVSYERESSSIVMNLSVCCT
jgi:hypothetical protein